MDFTQFNFLVFGVSSIYIIKRIVDYIKQYTGLHGGLTVLVAIAVGVALNFVNYFASINPEFAKFFQLFFYGAAAAVAASERADTVKLADANAKMLKYVVALPTDNTEPTTESPAK
jgi:hypothetical protein